MFPVRPADIGQKKQDEHKRYLKERDREQDQKRWLCFLQLARQYDRATSARRLLTELETRLEPVNQQTFDGVAAEGWLTWCRRWLDRYDPLRRKPQEIYQFLAETNSSSTITEFAWVTPADNAAQST
jgi:hypothetical protein